MSAILDSRTPAALEDGQKAAKVSLDSMAILRLYLFLLIISPSIYVVGPLGAAGTPAGILGCIMLILWLLERVARTQLRMNHSPLNWAVAGFALAMLLSFVAAMSRPAAADEVSAAQRGLISVASWLGVILYCSDTLRTREKLESFVRFTVLMGAVLATMGVVQFIWNVDFVSILHIPGLTENSQTGGLQERAGYVRVAGTATHSIEFSAVLGMVLPLAIFLARSQRNHRLWYWAQTGVIMASFPLTVARSGIISLVLGLIFALIVLRPAQRWMLLMMVCAGGVLFRGVLPGFLSVLRDLFANAGDDSSVGARVADYAGAWHFIGEAPLFGRGLFTFLPRVYRTFDNQYLGTLVETGTFGLASLCALTLVGILVSVRVAAHSPQMRLLAAGITTSLFVSVVIFFTFDALGFPMAAGMFTVVVGAAGALWRSFQGEQHELMASAAPSLDVRLVSIRNITLVAVLMMTFAVGAVGIIRSRDVYEATVSFVVRVGNRDAPNIYDERSSTFAVPNLLGRVMASQSVADELAGQGVMYYTTAVGTGSLAPFTDVVGDGDLMTFATRAESGNGATKNAGIVLAKMRQELDALQSSQAADVQPRILLADVKGPNIYPVVVHKPAALIAYMLFCAMLGQLGLDWLGSRRRRLLQARG